MQQRNGSCNTTCTWLGFAGGVIFTCGALLLFGPESAPPRIADAGDTAEFHNLATFPPTTARDCAIRAVYHFSDDDYGQRALIASAVLNTSTAPDVGLECGAPLLPSDVGGLPDPYRLQAAIDAVDAVASGSYELPVACDGVTAFASPEAAPRSQCVYRGLAFTTAEAR